MYVCAQCCFLIVYNRQTMQNITNASDWYVCVWVCKGAELKLKSIGKAKNNNNNNMHAKHLTFSLNLYSISEYVYFLYEYAHVRQTLQNAKSDEWKIFLSILYCTVYVKKGKKASYAKDLQSQIKKIREKKEWKKRRLADEKKTTRMNNNMSWT